jgi:hypothetical protein
MPYQHRPLSQILAPAAEPKVEGQATDQPRDPVTGKYVAPAAAPTQDKTDFTLPEKYVGKSAEEIAKMHMNAEQELGRVRNEVGTYRGLVNDLTSVQRQPAASQTVEPEKIDVSGDEILTNPAGAIDKVVTQRLAERDAKDNEVAATTQFELEGAALMNAYPDLDTIVASTEFQAFASRTPSRQNDFVTAAQGQGIEQVRAARRLLEDFKDFRDASTANAGPSEAQTQTPVQQAAAVATEGASASGAVSPKELIYEADVINLIHTNSAKYRSPSFQAELMAAIKEGRYVKSG